MRDGTTVGRCSRPRPADGSTASTPLRALSADATTSCCVPPAWAPRRRSCARLVDRASPRLVVVADARRSEPAGAARSPGPCAARARRARDDGATPRRGSPTSASSVCDGFRRSSRATRLAAVTAFAPTANHLDVALHGPLVITVDDVASGDERGAASCRPITCCAPISRARGHLAVAVPDSAETERRRRSQSVHREIWGLRLADAWVQRLAQTGSGPR